MLHARNPFRPPTRIRVERLASTLAFVLLLGSWTALYSVICPADHHPVRRFALVKVRP